MRVYKIQAHKKQTNKRKAYITETKYMHTTHRLTIGMHKYRQYVQYRDKLNICKKYTDLQRKCNNTQKTGTNRERIRRMTMESIITHSQLRSLHKHEKLLGLCEKKGSIAILDKLSTLVEREA